MNENVTYCIEVEGRMVNLNGKPLVVNSREEAEAWAKRIPPNVQYEIVEIITARAEEVNSNGTD